SMPMEIITDDVAETMRAGFNWRERDGLRMLVCTPLEKDGFANGFSTRLGGVSPMPSDSLNLAGFVDDEAENIYENRRRFLGMFDDTWTLTACWQMHSADVRTVRDLEDARCDTENCDALITSASQILLGVKTADCVPVIIGDAVTGACAAIHAGWRGTVAEIVPDTIKRMAAEFGTRTEDIRAAFGPAAGGCCDEVGAEVIEGLHRCFESAEDLMTSTRENHACVDLQRANYLQLVSSDVAAERIHIAPLCTMCRTDLFFSYRREKALHGRTGRLMSVIGRRANFSLPNAN
ncbi:MAG: peptidoglycan editing factor PgeF, partial [Pyrinomonadaceae bacterium]